MRVLVRWPALLADRISGIDSIVVEAATVGEAVRAVGRHHPELRSLLLTTTGDINPMLVVFLNDEQLSHEHGQAAVASGDEIEIVPAIEGGGPRPN